MLSGALVPKGQGVAVHPSAIANVRNRSVSDRFPNPGAKRVCVSRKSVPKRAAAVAAPEVSNPEPRLLGYACVSTSEQSTEQQRHALRAAGCAEVFEDVLSGASADRDGLATCLDALRPGDTLVVARLDRLGRSMPRLVSAVHELAARGVGFRSLAESIDTTSATGRLVLHLFAALADFERELISERTKASRAAKRRRGHRATSGAQPLASRRGTGDDRARREPDARCAPLPLRTRDPLPRDPLTRASRPSPRIRR